MILSSKASTDHAKIPALDGLRAIAVFGVILFHIYPPALPGGFAGVDVFFVLSGFLITSIILHDIQAGTFSFREFYLRRIQRLFPNAVSTVAVTILLITLFLPAGLEIFTARHGVWTLFNLSNIYTWIYHGGYWGINAEWSFLTHFWSLAVEEQFYILFPLILVLLTRAVPQHIRFWILAAIVASFALSLWGTDNAAAFTFYCLPTRIWELLLGAFLAATGISIYNFSPGKRRLSRPVCEFLGWGGVTMILLSFVFASGKIAFPGWIVLVPTLGTTFILISIICGENTFTRLLSTTPFTVVGKVSYSLYLWHWPLIILGKMSAELYGFSHITGAIIGGSVSLLAGTIAYFLIEQPLRQRGPNRLSRLMILVGIFSATLALCVWNAWFKPFHISSQFSPVTISGEYYEFNVPRHPGNAAPLTKSIQPFVYSYDVSPGKIPDENTPRKILKNGGLLHLYGGETPRVVLCGSSHGNMYAAMLDSVCKEKKITIAFFVKSGYPLFLRFNPDIWVPSNRAIQELNKYKMGWIQKWKPDVLFLVDFWLSYSQEEDFSAFQEQFETFLESMKNSPTKIVFVSQIPLTPHGRQMNSRAVVDFLTTSEGKRPIFKESEKDNKVRHRMDNYITKINSKYPNLIVIHPENLLTNPDGSIRYAKQKKFFYLDNDHLTDSGAEEVRSVFEEAIEKAINNKP